MTDQNTSSPVRKSGLRRIATKIETELEIDTRFIAMVGALLIIWVALEILTDGIFLTPRNLYNLAVQSTVVGIMATGMVFVIVARHIDLSVGSLVGVIGMVIAVFQVELFPVSAAWNWPLTIMIGLVFGIVIGCWNGYWIAYRGVPAFVVTLAGLLMFRGGAWLITKGRTVAPMDEAYQLLGGGISGSIGETWSWIVGLVAIAAVAWMTWRSRKNRVKHGFKVKHIASEIAIFAVWSVLIIGFVWIMNSYNKPRTEIPRGIPVPVLILISVVIMMTLISRMTRFGRYVFAMGGNPEAAELAGINVKKVTIMVFGLMGALCAIAAVITTARLNAGTNSMGLLSELNVIAAAVIGGTSLAGGVGTIIGAILGAVIMQSLENGMVLLGVSSAMRQIIIGLVLIVAVWLDTAYRNRK